MRDKINDSIKKCNEALDELRSSCCDGEKSKRMTKLIEEINKITEVMEINVDQAIEAVNISGGIVGELHVTCCTNGRDKKFQILLSELNIIFMSLWKVKGFDHS